MLFAGSSDGRHYLLAQFWVPGDPRAATVGYVQPASGEPELVLKPPVDDDAPVLVLALPPAATATTSTLLVVPRPGTGQVLYGQAASEYRPIDAPSALDGVVLIERRLEAEREGGDRLRLLDGNGRQFFDAEVASLLCGVDGCG